MNIELVTFFIFSTLLIFTCFKVITSSNPVLSAINLVFSFFLSAVLWLLLGAEFLSIILILVYVGAVMVLFLFVVMMLDINIAKKTAAYIKYLPLGIAVFIAFNILIIYFFINTFENIDYNAVKNIEIISDSNTQNLGYLLFTKYIIEFEIAGLILLLGIISAIVLTYRKNPKNKYQNPTKQISASKKDRLKIITDLKE
ncbi:MAG: NADH-quinone oxidoreductase subunit J [Gammaproteobacteria bacterium]|jgi:NADH-quinone oxidoreductase subunit J|tara:strand:- start:840 stop:1436 length:597 start_codon:yes stop_codon:yes gene_type:complete